MFFFISEDNLISQYLVNMQMFYFTQSLHHPKVKSIKSKLNTTHVESFAANDLCDIIDNSKLCS